MASAIGGLGDALRASEVPLAQPSAQAETLVLSPRRDIGQIAVRRLASDTELSVSTRVSLVQHFTEDLTAARTYLVLCDSAPAILAGWIEATERAIKDKDEDKALD